MRRTHAQAFTLIEILVALVVLAIMSVAAYAGLDALIKTREITHRNETHFRQLQLAMVTLTRDLEQAVVRPIRATSGALSPAMLGGDRDVPELTFTRSGRPNPLERPRSSLERVAYTVDHDELVRFFYQVLDRTVEETPSRQVLLSHVSALHVRFLDHSGQWSSHWPPMNAEPQAYERIDPVAVEITLQTQRWGKIRRLIELAH